MKHAYSQLNYTLHKTWPIESKEGPNNIYMWHESKKCGAKGPWENADKKKSFVAWKV
jgi:hypothetical protein